MTFDESTFISRRIAPGCPDTLRMPRFRLLCPPSLSEVFASPGPLPDSDGLLLAVGTRSRSGPICLASSSSPPRIARAGRSDGVGVEAILAGSLDSEDVSAVWLENLRMPTTPRATQSSVRCSFLDIFWGKKNTPARAMKSRRGELNLSLEPRLTGQAGSQFGEDGIGRGSLFGFGSDGQLIGGDC